MAGPAGREALPELIGLLRDEEWGIKVLPVLAAMGQVAAPAVSELIKVLGGDVDPRSTAIDILGSIGPGAAAALPAHTARSS
jgi:HEAT repeat protein